LQLRAAERSHRRHAQRAPPPLACAESAAALPCILRLCAAVCGACFRHKSTGGAPFVLVNQDQAKAYNCMSRTWVCDIMRHVQFAPKSIRFVRSVYANATTQYHTNSGALEIIPLRQGVLQGLPSSCLLYNIAYQPFISALEELGVGVQTPTLCSAALRTVTACLYADNSSIFLSCPGNVNSYQRARKLYNATSSAMLNNSTTAHIIGLPTDWTRAAAAQFTRPQTNFFASLGFSFNCRKPIPATG
jgi:hypothetical protein